MAMEQTVDAQVPPISDEAVEETVLGFEFQVKWTENCLKVGASINIELKPSVKLYMVIYIYVCVLNMYYL